MCFVCVCFGSHACAFRYIFFSIERPQSKGLIKNLLKSHGCNFTYLKLYPVKPSLSWKLLSSIFRTLRYPLAVFRLQIQWFLSSLSHHSPLKRHWPFNWLDDINLVHLAASSHLEFPYIHWDSISKLHYVYYNPRSSLIISFNQLVWDSICYQILCPYKNNGKVFFLTTIFYFQLQDLLDINRLLAQ